ncbi:MAG: metallophosphoesterase family protein [Planctomycetota bacterium]
MKIGILSDTHDQVARTQVAIDRLRALGVQAVVHCGDLTSAEIVEVCSSLPFYFVFGNHDADMAHLLTEAAERFGANCLKWGGEIELAGKRIAIAHGHFPKDFRPLLALKPDYFLFGHSHQTHDSMDGDLRRINPGALHRATEFTVATLDLTTDTVAFITIDRALGPSGVTGR